MSVEEVVAATAEFEALDKSRAIALLPVGAIEQHGPHLPVCVDAAINAGVLARALELLPEDLPIRTEPGVWNASTGSSAHGHVNAKQVMEVQDIFKARGYYFDALATRRLRVHSTLAYLAKRLLVFKRERPTSWVGKYVAKILAQQRTDVTPPGSVSVRG